MNILLLHRLHRRFLFQAVLFACLVFGLVFFVLVPEGKGQSVVFDNAESTICVGRNEIVMANPPQPRLSKQSQRWILERYSFSYDHIKRQR